MNILKLLLLSLGVALIATPCNATPYKPAMSYWEKLYASVPCSLFGFGCSIMGPEASCPDCDLLFANKIAPKCDCDPLDKGKGKVGDCREVVTAPPLPYPSCPSLAPSNKDADCVTALSSKQLKIDGLLSENKGLRTDKHTYKYDLEVLSARLADSKRELDLMRQEASRISILKQLAEKEFSKIISEKDSELGEAHKALGSLARFTFRLDLDMAAAKSKPKARGPPPVPLANPTDLAINQMVAVVISSLAILIAVLTSFCGLRIETSSEKETSHSNETSPSNNGTSSPSPSALPPKQTETPKKLEVTKKAEAPKQEAPNKAEIPKKAEGRPAETSKKQAEVPRKAEVPPKQPEAPKKAEAPKPSEVLKKAEVPLMKAEVPPKQPEAPKKAEIPIPPKPAEVPKVEAPKPAEVLKKAEVPPKQTMAPKKAEIPPKPAEALTKAEIPPRYAEAPKKVEGLVPKKGETEKSKGKEKEKEKPWEKMEEVKWPPAPFKDEDGCTKIGISKDAAHIERALARDGFNFRVADTPPDGRCQYNSILEAYKTNPNPQLGYRPYASAEALCLAMHKAITDTYAIGFDAFYEFVPPLPDKATRLREIKSCTCWGRNDTVTAAAILLKRNIAVHRVIDSGKHNFVVYNQDECALYNFMSEGANDHVIPAYPHETIHIISFGSDHFAALLPF